MIKALQAIVNRHFQDNPTLRPTKNILDMIITCSRGDIRGAIVELQLSSLVDKKPTKKGKKSGSSDSVAFLKLASQREQSLALFHLIGKIMYNKRMSFFPFGVPVLKCVLIGKGDPPSSSATKREQEQLRLLELSIPNPEKLPPHLKSHDRKASLVDVNVWFGSRFDSGCQADNSWQTLYADSPIDSSLFSLYLHQNCNQFCNNLEECGSIAEWMSWIDYSGPEEVCTSSIPCGGRIRMNHFSGIKPIRIGSIFLRSGHYTRCLFLYHGARKRCLNPSSLSS